MVRTIIERHILIQWQSEMILNLGFALNNQVGAGQKGQSIGQESKICTSLETGPWERIIIYIIYIYYI